MWSKERYRHSLSRRGVQTNLEGPYRIRDEPANQFQYVDASYYHRKGWRVFNRNTRRLVKPGAHVIIQEKKGQKLFFYAIIKKLAFDPVSYQPTVHIEEYFSKKPMVVLQEQIFLVMP